MPQLEHVLTQEDLTRRGTGGGPDLTLYMDIIDTLREQEGVGGVLSLDEGESQRTVKRRMSIAAKERDYQLTWRKAPEGQLRFVLAAPGEAPPDGRRRRTPSDQQAEQVASDAVMTDDVAEVTDTRAAPGESEPVATPRRRGRRRQKEGTGGAFSSCGTRQRLPVRKGQYVHEPMCGGHY